jgi:hypothetical protein
VEPENLTVRILQGIREDLNEKLGAVSDKLDRFHEDQQQFNRTALERFEVIETQMRDLAEQLVVLGRGIKIPIEGRSRHEGRIDDLERRHPPLEERST